MRFRHLAAATASLAASAAAVAGPAHAQSAPPPLTEGPVLVDAGGTPRPTTLLGSERDLDIPFTDLEDIQPVYVNSLGETGIITASAPGRNADGLNDDIARYGFDTGQLIPPGIQPGFVLLTTTTTFSYSVTESVVTRETRVGGGVTAQVRVAGLGTPLASATADTAAAAQALAMGQTSLAGLRGRILPPVVGSTGVTESVSETRSSAITGRDTYALAGFGNFTGINIVGNLGMCDRPLGTCQGGVTYDVPETNVVNVDFHVFQDLYVTTTIERLITATGTVTLDIPLAAYGRAHPAAQVVGFGQSDRFLGRLLAQGAAALGDGRDRADAAVRRGRPQLRPL